MKSKEGSSQSAFSHFAGMMSSHSILTDRIRKYLESNYSLFNGPTDQDLLGGCSLQPTIKSSSAKSYVSDCYLCFSVVAYHLLPTLK